MIHNTTIVGLALGTQSVLVLAQLTDLIVLCVLFARATPRNLWMTVGGAERTTLAVRCAGQMILNGCKNQSMISYRYTVLTYLRFLQLRKSRSQKQFFWHMQVLDKSSNSYSHSSLLSAISPSSVGHKKLYISFDYQSYIDTGCLPAKHLPFRAQYPCRHKQILLEQIEWGRPLQDLPLSVQLLPSEIRGSNLKLYDIYEYIKV